MMEMAGIYVGGRCSDGAESNNNRTPSDVVEKFVTYVATGDLA